MEIREKINAANEAAVHSIIDSDPYWVDVQPAGECVNGLTDHMILHSGPPVAYEDMVMLHKRGMVSAMLFEGWAKDEQEAVDRIRAGEVKIESALDHNTVGAGTGIITQSVMMNVVEDRKSGKRAATFPAEGPFQGGFCGWGLYSEGIAENLRMMREELFPVIREMLVKRGGLAIKPILAEGMQMGDENHTRQTAADLLFDKQILPDLFAMDIPKEQMMKVVRYIVETPRFFHCYGQGASRAALLAAEGTAYSTMVTAVCGNGVDFGIKVAGMPGAVVPRACADDERALYLHQVYRKRPAPVDRRQLCGRVRGHGRVCRGGQPHYLQPARNDAGRIHCANPGDGAHLHCEKPQLPHPEFGL